MSSSAFAPGPNSATQPRLRARRARVPAAIAGATPPAPPRGLGIGDRPFLGLPRRHAARHVRVERCAKCDALGKSLGSNMRECCRRAAGLAEAPSRARAALGAAAVGGVATAAYAAYGGFGNGNGGAGGKGFGGGGNGGGGGGGGGIGQAFSSTGVRVTQLTLNILLTPTIAAQSPSISCRKSYPAPLPTSCPSNHEL